MTAAVRTTRSWRRGDGGWDDQGVDGADIFTDRWFGNGGDVGGGDRWW
jgi:hypothetical protein